MKLTLAIALCAILAACGNSSNNSTETTNDSMDVNGYDSNNRGTTVTDTTGMHGNMNGNVAVSIDPADTNFISKAMMGGQMEVDLGNMASSQGSNERVKQFASMMVRDHSQANSELKNLTGNMSMPATMPKDMQATRDHLTKLNGAAFDKAYMMHMVSDHKKDISLFEKASRDAKTQQVKDFATRTLPTLKMHLDSAMAVQKSLK